MNKKVFGPQTWLYVEPTVLVGSNVNGKPNFMAVAWAGIACGDPPMISVALRHIRYTLKGVRQNMTFSVNVPSTDMVKETDYCGIVSGEKANKVKDCNFKIFYGALESAPLIEQCPVNLECEVVHILNLGSHSLVIGKIVQTHVSEDCLTDEQPDVNKIKPIIYIPRPLNSYRAVGKRVAKPFSVGKELKKVTKSRARGN
jgi:flavin reductase (DIM6/NTAB) family NADH-FMN oxidoreductase RutF